MLLLLSSYLSAPTAYAVKTVNVNISVYPIVTQFTDRPPQTQYSTVTLSQSVTLPSNFSTPAPTWEFAGLTLTFPTLYVAYVVLGGAAFSPTPTSHFAFSTTCATVGPTIITLPNDSAKSLVYPLINEYDFVNEDAYTSTFRAAESAASRSVFSYITALPTVSSALRAGPGAATLSNCLNIVTGINDAIPSLEPKPTSLAATTKNPPPAFDLGEAPGKLVHTTVNVLNVQTGTARTTFFSVAGGSPLQELGRLQDTNPSPPLEVAPAPPQSPTPVGGGAGPVQETPAAPAPAPSTVNPPPANPGPGTTAAPVVAPPGPAGTTTTNAPAAPGQPPSQAAGGPASSGGAGGTGGRGVSGPASTATAITIGSQTLTVGSGGAFIGASTTVSPGAVVTVGTTVTTVPSVATASGAGGQGGGIVTSASSSALSSSASFVVATTSGGQVARPEWGVFLAALGLVLAGLNML